ncbi:MAG: penicillin-binding protein activator LpoB [Prevotella sp.]|nr:penicillin-binding protein activator LpoB [Prevotella sp.]
MGVSAFTSEVESKYNGAVTEKVVEILTQTKRFQVVDRTSMDKVYQELELQKSEAFIDSKNTAEQGVAMAAESIITGHIVKLPVYRMTNGDGSTRGYKASVYFQLKVVDVATGLSNEATSFEGKASKEMLSPESAVANATASLENELRDYFLKNFPVKAKISKIIETKKEEAKKVLINAGKLQGLKVGDKLSVERIETLDGQAYPSVIGEIKVETLAGESFSECSVSKGGEQIKGSFDAAENLNCKLIIK